jgi:hypothetical protein
MNTLYPLQNSLHGFVKISSLSMSLVTSVGRILHVMPDVFSMPPSGSSYELNGTPPLFRSIPPYLQIQVVRSGKSSFLCPFFNRLIPSSSPTDVRVPASFTFHLAEIYLEELEKAVCVSDFAHPRPHPRIIPPFIFLAAHTPTNTMYKPILKNWFVQAITRRIAATSSQTGTSLRPRVLLNACADIP